LFPHPAPFEAHPTTGNITGKYGLSLFRWFGKHSALPYRQRPEKHDFYYYFLPFIVNDKKQSTKEKKTAQISLRRKMRQVREDVLTHFSQIPIAFQPVTPIR
jgi:hypothetical protein